MNQTLGTLALAQNTARTGITAGLKRRIFTTSNDGLACRFFDWWRWLANYAAAEASPERACKRRSRIPA